MAYGLHRFNERHQRPNKLINFIKPLDGADKEVAQDFLERIAAIVYPVMKANTISVMSLEEFPPNREFVGRNFNAGECIQLVLKSASTGAWLSFRSVQMVMMHELAHCKQMNHSRAFWKVRNDYADHLRVLWSRDYHGEGVWGRGQLLSGRIVRDTPDVNAGQGVESLCGGAYRGRGGKRKRKNESAATYAERQQRRIERKFGKHGQGNAVGADYRIKDQLEKGRWTDAKPRVANSKRGRELRAAAALARFDKSASAIASDESTAVSTPVESDTESETESATESEGDEYDDDLNGPVLLDDKGDQVTDSHGNGLVRVCDTEDVNDIDDENVRRELEDLRTADRPSTDEVKSENTEAHGPAARSKRSRSDAGRGSLPVPVKVDRQDEIKTSEGENIPGAGVATDMTESTKATCPVCSLENDMKASTCVACAHVLDKRTIAGAWKCDNSQCAGRTGVYLNAGDCGVCGLCGQAKGF